MIWNSPAVATLLVVDTLAVGLFNIGGMAISPGLDPVFLTVVESLRTLLVWGVGAPPPRLGAHALPPSPAVETLQSARSLTGTVPAADSPARSFRVRL